MSTGFQIEGVSSRATWRAIGWAALGVIAVTALLHDFFAHAPSGSQAFGPMLAPPSAQFVFGTDILGRDVYSETLHGLWITVWQAATATLIATVAGSVFGTVCARLPGFWAATLRWIGGVLASVPALFLALLFVGLTSHAWVAAAAGLAAAPPSFLRAFDRADVRSVSSHAVFARATGISVGAMLRNDIVCEFDDGMYALLARALAAVSVILATVSFLGFGAAPPARDLGLMISAARGGYFGAWWPVLFPALMLVLLILSARLAAGMDEGERP
jgi:peptide/nickel transport system permease protein